MAVEVKTALRRRDRLWPAVAASIAAHAAVLAWAVARTPAAPIDLEQKPIVARLVRLGEKRPEQFLPRKQEPPPAPAPAPKSAAPVVAAPVPPAPKTAPSFSAKAPPPKPVPARATPASSPGRAAGTSLSNVLSRVQKEVDQTHWGDPNGDPAGDADEASAGDRYLALAVRALQQNYRLPSTISEKERMYLKATVVLLVDPDGRIARWRFEARSGNGAYDDALERAIGQTRLPPPPPEVREQFRTVGLGVKFHI